MENGKLKIDNSHWSKKRYQDYKDSSIEWLRKVPEHWKVSHVKRICKNVTDGAHTSPDISSNDYPFLTVVNLKNGVLDFENCLYTSSSDYKKLVRNGCNPKVFDVLYSKDGTISESVVINENRNFVVGSSFIILSPILKNSNSEYLSYLLSSNIMRFQASLYIKGASLPRISIFNVAKLFCVVPSLLEQKQIAHYLDRKTAQIDRKIDLLTQKVNKYEELKKSLINETVTRGLDKSVAMKDSSIEWIGEIPKHWDIRRIKDIGLIVLGKMLDNKPGDGKFYRYYLKSKNIGWLDVNISSVEKMYFTSAEMKICRLKSGDLLLSEGGEVGKTSIWEDNLKECYI